MIFEQPIALGKQFSPCLSVNKIASLRFAERPQFVAELRYFPAECQGPSLNILELLEFLGVR